MIELLLAFPPIVAGAIFLHDRRHHRVKNIITSLLVLVFLELCLAAFLPETLNVAGLEFEGGILQGIFLFSMASCFFLTSIICFDYPYSKRTEFSAALFLLLLGLAGTALSANLITLIVFLDVLIFSAGYLITFSGCLGLVSSFKFVTMQIIGSSFLLAGALLAPQNTGSASTLGEILVSLAFMIKIGIFPLHFWVVDSYSHSPIPVAVILASAGAAASTFAFMKTSSLANQDMMLVAASASMLLTALFAFGEKKIMRVVPYTCISESSLCILAFIISPAIGFFFLVTQAFGKALALSCLFEAHRKVKTFSIVGFGLFVAALAFAGIPPAATFIPKISLAVLMLKTNLALLCAILISAFILLATYLRVINYLVYKKEGEYEPSRLVKIAVTTFSTALIVAFLFGPQIETVLKTLIR